jgi:high-affinity iron transporter
MIAALLIVFREVLEAGLIISLVVAACTGLPVKRQVFFGVVLGLIGAVLLAKFTDTIESALSGYGQEIFNAAILLAATLMLSWQNIWMSVKGREMALKNKQQVQTMLEAGRGGWAIIWVIAIAVLREGSEIVLFLYSIYLSAETSANSLLIGGLVGVGLGSLVSYICYRGIVMIPLKLIFTSSSFVLTLIAAGLCSQALGILGNIGLVPVLGYQVWNSSSLLSERSWAGVLAHAVFGYTSTPMGIQIVTWFTVIIVVTGMSVYLKQNNQQGES